MQTIFTYPSEKNGEITVWRSLWFGPWQIRVGDCGQTTLYTNRMWKKVIARVARMGVACRSVCIGGLGGGGQIPLLKKKFPGCTITVIEHDPVMISVAEKYHLFAPSNDVQIIEGDMFEVIPKLDSPFDLVFVDLFTGENPDAATTSDTSIAKLKKSMAPRGLLVVNVFHHTAYLKKIEPHFLHSKILTYQYNTLGIFWNHER